MKVNEKFIAGAIILVCMIFILTQLPTILQSHNPDVCYINGVCQHEKQLNTLTEAIPLFVAIGIVIGALVFLFMSGQLQRQKQSMKTTSKILLQFLNEDERIVVSKLIENNGKVLQSEITRLPEIGKVKSHRLLQKLQDKGVIKIEGHGKTNIVSFTKEIKESLV